MFFSSSLLSVSLINKKHRNIYPFVKFQYFIILYPLFSLFVILPCSWFPISSPIADARIALEPYDWAVRVWDTGTSQCLYVLEGYTDAVMFLAWTQDGYIFASALYNITVKLRDLDSIECAVVINTLDASGARRSHLGSLVKQW